MIKLRKDKTIVLGLSEENITRLKKNQPIRFKLSDLIPGDEHTVFIIAGKTEDSMALSIKSFVETTGN